MKNSAEQKFSTKLRELLLEAQREGVSIFSLIGSLRTMIDYLKEGLES